jgi:hypothetical protein
MVTFCYAYDIVCVSRSILICHSAAIEQMEYVSRCTKDEMKSKLIMEANVTSVFFIMASLHKCIGSADFTMYARSLL